MDRAHRIQYQQITVLENVIDLNNANGLPTNINANQYVDNSCETSNPSGLCIGR